MGLTAVAWLFGITALVLVLLALGFALWPLARRAAGAVDGPLLSRKGMNVRLYRERVSELNNAVRLGEMTADEAQLQEEEAARHLLSDAQAEPARSRELRPGGGWLYVLVALFVPVGAILIYMHGGSWRLLAADEKSPPWDFIIHRAQARLEENPRDTETRAFLARSYRALEQYQAAVQAYARLNEQLSPPNPDFLVEEGEVRAMLGEGDLQGKPTDLFHRALQINPRHGQALWYAGLAALQREDRTAAARHWRLLARQELPESFRHVLERQLTRLGAEAPSARAHPDQAAAGPVIRLQIEARDELVDGLPKDTPVFVYAKAGQGAGRPLAVKQLILADLPTETILDNDMTMAGGPALSEYDRWMVYARVALGGDAIAQPGDPYGMIELDHDTALQSKRLIIEKRWQE